MASELQKCDIGPRHLENTLAYVSQETPLVLSCVSPRNSEESDPCRQRGDWDGDDRQPKRRRTSRSGSSNNTEALGCPFYFHNQEQHQSCLTYTLKRVGDVRQHICRRHYVQPSYCPRCGIEFPDDLDFANLDAHLGQKICRTSSNVPRRSWATPAQLKAMDASPSSRASSEEERWYAIWAIMFPGKPRPLSIFIDAKSEWRYRGVHAGIEHYCQNGGPKNFIRKHFGGADVLQIFELFLDDLCQFNRTYANAVDHHRRHDVSVDTMGQTQSSIPIPPLSALGEGVSVLAFQPTLSLELEGDAWFSQRTYTDPTNAGYDPNFTADNRFGYE